LLQAIIFEKGTQYENQSECPDNCNDNRIFRGSLISKYILHYTATTQGEPAPDNRSNKRIDELDAPFGRTIHILCNGPGWGQPDIHLAGRQRHIDIKWEIGNMVIAGYDG
jgi:hypothetical protein